MQTTFEENSKPFEALLTAATFPKKRPWEKINAKRGKISDNPQYLQSRRLFPGQLTWGGSAVQWRKNQPLPRKRYLQQLEQQKALCLSSVNNIRPYQP